MGRAVTRGKRIPKIMFRASPFSLRNLPPALRAILCDISANNPDVIQVYSNNDSNREFMKGVYPRFLHAYDSLKPAAFKCDLWRLLVVYTFGGVYNDAGHAYLKQIADIIDFDNDEFVFPDENNKMFHNGFFAAYPHHPILWAMIRRIVKNVTKRDYGEYPTDITGPMALAKAFNAFLGRQPKTYIQRGKYAINNFKLHVCEWRWNGSSMNMALYDNNGDKFINSKFENYYKIMYDDRHQQLWHQMYANEDVFT